MFAPVEAVTLSTNPKFSALYTDLCANKLNPDGTSKIYESKALKEREAFAEDLRKARIEAAKRELIVSGLRAISYDDGDLSQDLRELVLVVAALLEGQIPEEDRDLLQDDAVRFKDNMRPIAAALSKHFNRDVTSLAALFDPDDPPPIRELVASINRLKSSIATSELKSAEIPSSLAQEAAKVHALNRQVIKTSIRILEQTIHGSVARGSKAKAEYLAAVAGGMNTKLSLQHGQLMAQVYSPEMQDALRAKTEEIDQRSRTAKRQIREAEERLDGYSKIGGMDAIAREYAEIMRERQSVEAEIERLEKQS